ncbi:hypothetical protein [Georgenia sp. AZ-5]|uniref:hypothetical protein n=1 Tax=Georgenia sp. AZ-5 TaxID=3367526 RepID=UPI003754CD07
MTPDQRRAAIDRGLRLVDDLRRLSDEQVTLALQVVQDARRISPRSARSQARLDAIERRKLTGGAR